jgi:hypothetical protein
MAMSNYLLRVCGVVAILGVLSVQTYALEAIWIGGPAGSWSEPANWSTGVVPNVATTHVTIDDNALQDTVAILNQNTTVGNLTIDNGDELNFDPSRTLTATNVTLAGDINFAPSSQLRVRDLAWVQPSGVMSLVDTSQITGAASPYYLLWNEGRIEGAGQISSTGIGAALNNEGTIVANVPGKQLNIGLYGTLRRGLHNNLVELIAENGGRLNITGLGDSSVAFFTPLENANGTIEARGDSTIFLSKIRLVGGTLSTSTVGGINEGLITFNSVMFENITLEGNLALNSVTFADRVTNNTDRVVNSFFVEGYATITGNGSMDLNGGSVNVPGQGFGGYLVGTPGFVNDVNHTIKGPGGINLFSGGGTGEFLSVDNRGLIETDRGVFQFYLRPANSSTITLNSQSSFNSGTIRAKTGGRLEILANSTSASYAEVLTNFSSTMQGVIEAAPDSTVALGNIRLRGGILRAATPEEGSTAQPGKVISSGTTVPLLENIHLEGAIGDANSKWGLFGEIENTQSLAGQFTVFGPTTLKGGGEIKLFTGVIFGGGIAGSNSNNSFFDPLINEDNLIHGVGSIGSDLAFVNRAIVQADVPNGMLGIAPSSQNSQSQYPNAHWNSGLLQAINGGELDIRANIVNHEGGDMGTIHAGDGSEVRVAGVDGGLLTTEGTGKIIATGASLGSRVLSNVHNQGSLHLLSLVGFAGRIVNDGTVVNDSTATIYFNSPFAELTGNGTWGLSNSNLSLNYNISESLLINDSQHTMQGGGTMQLFRGAFINRGTLIANGNNPLVLDIDTNAYVQQEGNVIVPVNRKFYIDTVDSQFTNNGTINVTGEMRFFTSGGPFEFVNASGGVISVSGDILASFNASVRNELGALFKGDGTVNLRLISSTLPATFVNEGILRPESSASHIGSLLFDSDFEQKSSGVFEVDLNGTDAGEYDKLLLDDSVAKLGGTLDVSLLGNFEPAVGDLYTILDTQGGMVTGVFGSVGLPALAGRWWSLDYQTDKVVLGVFAITADFNLDGYVDGADLALWQGASQGGTAAGDADGDGDSDGRDFFAWQRQFGAGINPAATSVAVPEPSSLALFILSMAVASLRRVE